MIKEIFKVMWIAIFICAVQNGTCIAAGMADLTAKSAIVIEAKTGKVLFERNADEILYPASTTKMMTLLVALENGNLDEMVTVSKAASEMEGSSLDLKPGERMRLHDLLYGMMLISGNDAATAIAEHIAGSVPNFAERMTQKAREIGTEHTTFVNSCGLPDPRHVSTARDLAKIAAYGYRDPRFAEIVGTKEHELPHEEGGGDRFVESENQLLWIYKGGNGVKTGYTVAAGRCLVSAAERDGVQIVAVVLDSKYMWNDSIALLDYGFTRVEAKTVLHAGDSIKTAMVVSGRAEAVELVLDRDLDIPVVDGDDSYDVAIEAPDQVYAPVEADQLIGKVILTRGGSELASADLVAIEAVERKSLFLEMRNLLLGWIDKLKQAVWSA